MRPAPLACRPRLPDQPRGDPDPTLRAPAALDRRPPISRSHLTNSSFDAGPEESPYEGGKFYVSPTPPQIAPHQPAGNESPPRAPFSPVIPPLRAPPTLAPLTERAESPRLITQVDIQLTNSYPFEAPKMRFITKVWHPNVSSANGAICLDILKDQWSPALSIKTAMLSLQALLSTPEPNDPQDAVVAKQYLDSYEEFVKHAKEWTAKYASENRKDEKEEKLKEMGFGEAAVRNALSRAAGDEQQALELLLTGL